MFEEVTSKFGNKDLTETDLKLSHSDHSGPTSAMNEVFAISKKYVC